MKWNDSYMAAAAASNLSGVFARAKLRLAFSIDFDESL
jgi:hypothetical protein